MHGKARKRKLKKRKMHDGDWFVRVYIDAHGRYCERRINW